MLLEEISCTELITSRLPGLVNPKLLPDLTDLKLQFNLSSVILTKTLVVAKPAKSSLILQSSVLLKKQSIVLEYIKEKIMNNVTTADPNTSISTCLGGIDTLSSIVIGIVHALAALPGVFGNVMVLLAVYTTPSLRSVSNYLITSLAAVDLIVSLVVHPLFSAKGFLKHQRSDNALSTVIEFLAIQTAVMSALNMCAISVERYIGVTMVFRYYALVTGQRCVYVIIYIWTATFFMAIPRLFIDDTKDLVKLYIVAETLGQVLPFLIIAFCYFHIFRAARAQSKRIVAASSAAALEAAEVAKRSKAAYTVAIIIGLFILLATPGVIVAAMQTLSTDPCRQHELRRIWFYVAPLSLAASVFNPWVYGIRSKEFRNAFKKIIGLSTGGVRVNSLSSNRRPRANKHSKGGD